MLNVASMSQLGGKNKTDGNGGKDVVVVSFVNAIVILTRCGGGMLVPVIEQILEVIASINKVVDEVVDLVKCGVGVFVFMVLLVVVVEIALLSRVVACRREVAVMQVGDVLTSTVLQ